MAVRVSNLDAYQSGSLLAEAAHEDVPSDLKRAYEYAEKRQRVKQAAERLEYVCLLRDQDWSDEIIASTVGIDLRELRTEPFYRRDFSKYLRVLRPFTHRRFAKKTPDQYYGEMCDHKTQRIRAGKYVLFGYKLPRKLRDAPRQVPDDIVQSKFTKVYWALSRISGNGLDFVAVRVVLIEAQVAAGEEGIRSKGYPKRDAEIRGAYRALAVTPGGPRKPVYDAIRKMLIKSPADSWGLSDDTIWRSIQDLHRPRKTANSAN